MMHLHTVTIPAATAADVKPFPSTSKKIVQRVAADFASVQNSMNLHDAFVANDTYRTLEQEGVTFTFAPVPLPAPTDDPIRWVAQLGNAIAANVATGLTSGDPVLVLGGNCNALVGVLGGFQRALGPDAKVGLVWFDAHGDFNTPKTTITGRLGGMPVAAAAGLCFPAWRETAGMATPLPTDRIVMVDVRNLDPNERTLVEATDVTIAAVEEGRPGMSLQLAIDVLARDCDVIYLHVDEDILDAQYVPNHGTAEPDGPDIPTVQEAIRVVLRTGKVRAFGLVSVYLAGEGADTSLASGAALLTAGVRDWLMKFPR